MEREKMQKFRESAIEYEVSLEVKLLVIGEKVAAKKRECEMLREKCHKMATQTQVLKGVIKIKDEAIKEIRN